MSRIIFNMNVDALRAQGWAMVPNQVLREPKLSGNARTLFGILCSFNDGYEFSLNYLVKLMGCAASTYQRAFRELEDCGLAARTKLKINGRWDWTIQMAPSPETWKAFQTEEEVETPQVDSPSTEKRRIKEDYPEEELTNTARAETTLEKHDKAVELAQTKYRYEPKVAVEDRPSVELVNDPEVDSTNFVVNAFAYYGHRIAIGVADQMCMTWRSAGKTRNDFLHKLTELHADPEKIYPPKILARIMFQDAYEKRVDKRERRETYQEKTAEVARGPSYENRLRPESFVQLELEPEKPVDPVEQELIGHVMAGRRSMDELVEFYERRAQS